jgi:glycosyltransferase involved in cell wall biosynthesis
MRILMAHNFYQQKGGEDVSFAAEAAIMEANGHQVIRYTDHNDRVANMRPVPLARATVWNQESYRALRELMRKEKPQVAHFQNTFPLISPAAYYAAKAEGVAVVQSLRNYRLLCPNAFFFRAGRVCENCMSKMWPWPGIVYGCYRNSRLATGVVAAMIVSHRAMGTWETMVDSYIALTEFARQKFIDGGLPPQKIAVKPNFVYPNPPPRDDASAHAIFVGRLSPEKGVPTVLNAWERLSGKILLKIVGDGPLASLVSDAAGRIAGIEWLGQKSADEVADLIGSAAVLIFASEWYETFGRVIIEAFAHGTPVIAANLGAAAELIDSGRTGLLFRPGDAEDLAAKVEWAATNPAALTAMRKAARAEFEAKYTAEKNYEMLMNIYQAAIESSITKN